MRAGSSSSTLIDLLAPRAVERGSGIITATRGKQKRLLCLERARLVFAVSNVLEEQFAERLLAAGALTPADRGAVEREASRTGRKFAAVLREAGFVTDDVLVATMSEHVRALTLDCLQWTDAQFRFEPGLPSLEGEVRGDVPIAELVLAHVGAHPRDLDMVRIRIGPPDLQVVVDRDSADAVGDHRDATLAHVLSRAETPVPVGEVAATAPDGAEQAFRTIHGLLLMRVLRRSDTVSASAAARAEERSKQVTREEIEGWISRSRTASHYDILGVPQSASVDEIRAGYYRHARRLHPDRLRSGPHADLLPQIEEFFGKVTEAYNTLQDRERRLEYDVVLRESWRSGPDDAADRDTGYLARQNFLRAKAALDRRRLAEALSFLENAVRLDESNAEYLRELGRVLSTNPRRRNEAEEHLRRAIAIDPSAAEPYVTLGDLLARADRVAEATELLREALRWDPDHGPARSRLQEFGIDPDADA
jgi:curved DNA-binding protein CbpA